MSWPNNTLDTELALEITLILEYDKKLWMLDYHARRDIDKIIAAIWSISLPAVHSAVFASSPNDIQSAVTVVNAPAVPQV